MFFVVSHIIQKSEKLDYRRDIIASNTKKNNCPSQEIKGEDVPSFSIKKGNVPWILNKYDRNLAKEVILDVKAPSCYVSSLRHCFTTYEKLTGLKSHDHLNLLRVHIMSKK